MYFAGNFGWFNIHAKVYRWVLMVYPIATSLTGLQVPDLAPYLAKMLPRMLGYYRTPNNTWAQIWAGAAARRSLTPLAAPATLLHAGCHLAGPPQTVPSSFSCQVGRIFIF
ncbi:hypothetical protein DSO57_1004090 [Entomophthora muscae]|uniref:Uncharacterized protein n=1 Tax=Entomophthora muscae TaxID=34485 RepID=A0ACC2SY22_9FUNG|nr:hypothetical protein DSO57_1004090 [Entomophthora muscae]